jgi:hypothetical protein
VDGGSGQACHAFFEHKTANWANLIAMILSLQRPTMCHKLLHL